MSDYDDREIVLAAVQEDGRALEFVDERFKDDREIVLAAVQQNGWALEYASERLRDDDDIVRAAAEQNSDSTWYYASPRLQNKKW